MVRTKQQISNWFFIIGLLLVAVIAFFTAVIQRVDIKGELVQCEKALEVVREDNYRLNFPERFDRCSKNPYTNQVVCEVCIRGNCENVYEYYDKKPKE